MVGESIQPTGANEPVAVVGMSCRLPQAANPGQFWALLAGGVDAVTAVPQGRWPDATDSEFRRGGFVAEVDRFDAAFFGISPNEAAAMDPQQRLALELAWEALENARTLPAGLGGTPAAVFVGTTSNDYAVLQDRLAASGPGRHNYTGANRAIIANRVSYFLGLQGPSLTVDTGQSSSLVAVQLACESLRRGEASLAIAGGVNLNLLGGTTAAIGSFGALSQDGRCYALDSRANGYVRGEGGGFVVLKPLSAALAAGDAVHCVILGGAVNNDGGGDGLTVPSRRAQESVLRLACERAGVRPADVQYVELHGTGTRVGDPIEAGALGAVLGAERPAQEPLLVGSVKTNIGHLEGAAGIAGLLKVALSLRHRQVPPSLNFETPNPDIPLEELRLRVPTAAMAWPRDTQQLVAGVSSFGMGGTNCHLVLAAAPEGQPAGERRGKRVRRGDGSGRAGQQAPWLLSARSAEALRAQAASLRDHLAEHEAIEPADVALSLLRSRTAFEHRAVILGEGRTAKFAALEAVAGSQTDRCAVTGSAAAGRCAFVFPGQGSQWPHMARGLLETSPAFAGQISECAKALEPFVDYSLLDVLRGEPGAPGLDRVDVVQPALWAVMVSLAALWRSHGVEPDMVIGHSQGEIAAATAAGALSLSDGARVVALRSRAITGIAGSGGMMSVAASLETVEAAVRPRAPRVTVAAVNGPRSVVVSGERAELEELQGELEAAGHRAKLIPVDYASHSVAVERIREELLEVLAPVSPVSIPTLFISTLTGEPIDTAELNADYWYRSLRHTVRFTDATRAALAAQCGRFIECSPHPVLVTGVEETIDEADREAVVVGTLRRDDGGPDRFQRALAEAYACGASVDWTGQCDVPGARLVDLPTYAFQRRRHWLGDGPGIRRAIQAAEPGETAVEPAGETAAGPPPALSSRRAVRELVLNTAADVLGHSDTGGLPPNRTFKDLGFESATVVDLRNRLRSATGLRLPAGLLFDYPTPDQLIDHLHGQLGGDRADTDVAAVTVSPTGATAAEDDPIVVVGMGCRYPGDVASPEDLWALVDGGVDAISEFPTNRGWDHDTLFATGTERSGTSDTRYGGFLHRADEFDAGFFGISPREAAAMDPQQRLLLEICWETVERAGIEPARLRGSATGVFVGAMAPDYGPRLHQPAGAVEGHLLTGTALSVVSGRIAYALGLQGQALTVDTACSSSLVAIVLAMQALRRGECSLALAGGATVMSTPGMFVEFSRQGGLATDGRCKAFSASADGTGWAEGAGMLLLERRSDAIRNGHPVLAVIRGGAVNQDGASNGLTAPNGQAQREVIRTALADARLTAAEVDAVEAHGTGTTLGDPIEADSIIATYGQDRDRPVWLGSLKSNLGHTQAAAGVGGVIKMVMAMRSGVLPRTLHVDEPTPHVDWDAAAVRLLTEPVPWPQAERPARAAVSSFGISGTNAHVIIEHVAEPEIEPEPAEPLVWVLSAKTDTALRAKAQRLSAFATSATDADLVAAAHNLASRARFAHRAVVVAADRDELTAGLGALATGTPHPAVVHGVAAADEVKPVFVFPGQGSQWAGMAVELLETNEAFRDQLTRCDEALAPHTGWSVIGVLRGDPDAPELESSAVIQPALFAVMVSLAAVWRSIGVHPAAVIGHSQGEITAACAAGALSVQDAAKVVALRSKSLMKLTGTGGMLAVSMPAQAVRERLAPWEGRLWTAIMSGPESTVVAGDLDALEEFAATLDDTVRARRVAIDYAAHTPHIEALHSEIVETLGEILPQPTDVAFCSALYAGFIDAAELTAEYWFNGLRNPVRFEEAIRAFAGGVGFAGAPLFVESSPHPVLTGHIQDTLSTMDSAGAGAVGSLRRGEGGWRRFLLAAAQAYTQGAAVDWNAALGTAPARHVAVPTYPFEHRRYWVEGGGAATDVTATGLEASRHPLLGAVVPLAEGDGFVLAGRLSRSATPWLADHVVEGEVLLPGTAFVELGLEAASIAGCDEVEDLTLQAPLILPATGAVQFQVKVGGSAQAGDGRRELSVYSRLAGDPEAAWTRNATGMLAPAGAAAAERLAEWPPAGAVAVDLDDAYGRLSDRGYDYGPTFQGLLAAWRAGSDAYVEVALPEAVRGDAGRFTLHPALLDAALHLLVLDAVDAGDEAGLLLPFSWTGVRVDALGADALRVRISAGDDDQVSLAIHDAAGNRIAGVQALTLRRVPRAAGAAQAQADPVVYAVDWVDLAAPATAAGGQRWAIVGYGEFADELGAALQRAGVDAARYYDLSSLADMSAGEVPATVLVPYQPEPDPDAPYAVREGLYQVLDLVQGWVGDERYAQSRLVFVTSGAFGPGEPGEAGLTGGPVWGLIRSAQSEHPGRFALVDIAGSEDESADWAKVAAVLAGEPGESQLVVRGGTVSVPRLAKRGADGETGTAPAVPDLGSGTVLVTGGTGRLGGLVAERLVERCGARDLLLVSRRGSQAPGAAELVARLAELGATATIADCDVSDLYALRRLLDSLAPERPLCAVVHTAGVVDDATVERLSGQQLDGVFAPKADAAWHLHELTRDRELAAFVMFSSVAGLLGNPGQGNYAAANVFLDILAAHRRSLGLPAVSIAWGLWGTEDSAGDGMAGHLSAADVARLERSGIAAMPAEYGLQLLDAALTAADPLVVAAKWDQGGLRSRAESDTLPPVLRSLVRAPRRAASGGGGAATTGTAAATSGSGALVERLVGLSEVEGRRLLAQLVRSHVAAVLAHDSVDGVDVDKVFNELGFDSLTAVELRNRLNAETGLRLPATVVFAHPTVIALAEYLYTSLAPEAPSPEDTLRNALEQVEQMLAGGGDAAAVRGKLVALLQAGLAKFGGENRSNRAAEQIDSASDEEIFALIDKEL